jgi:hypothetical protein
VAWIALGVVIAATALTGPAASAATFNVDCSTQDLQHRITTAPTGSTLRITGTCRGTFTVTKNLTLQGNPTATLDGELAGTTLSIPGAPTVHLIRLTVTGGAAPVGGGIHAAAGRLTLDHVTVADNLAITDFASGGGIAVGGPLVLRSSVVRDNAVYARATTATQASGGGIFVDSGGSLVMTRSSVVRNRAMAASSSGIASALGGGIHASSGSLVVSRSHVDANTARATSGGSDASGGAVYGSKVSITGSTMNGNVARAVGTGNSLAFVDGGALALIKGSPLASVSSSVFAADVASASSSGGQVFLSGGAIWVSNAGGGLKLQGSTITGTRATASGGADAHGSGAAIDASSPLTVVSSTISANALVVHSGNLPADAAGGGISGTEVTVTRSTLAKNRLTSSSATSDASADGGAATVSDQLTMLASTVSGNTVDATAHGSATASAHAGGVQVNGSSTGNTITNSSIAGNAVHAHAPSNAFAAGGGLESTATALRVTNSTIARNTAGERGGGLVVGGGSTTLEATILALNKAPIAAGPNCRGTVTSADHNLLGTKSGCNFTARPHDRVGLDPKLGLLADNGGPTRTLALLTGSPALNAIAKTACAVHADQRGVPRPEGPGCDIGSYERKP